MLQELHHPLKLARRNKTFKANLTICRSQYKDLDELISILSPNELSIFNNLNVDKRRLEYCLGRYVGKKSISKLIACHNLKKISIERGTFNQPVIYFMNNPRNIQLSISHVCNTAVAIAFPEEHPMGIDMEKITEKNNKVLSSLMLEDELKLLELLPYNKKVGLTLMWTVKESLSKVLRTGLTVPFPIYSVSGIKEVDGGFVSVFTHFSQYKVFSWMVAPYVISICLPKKTVMDIDIQYLSSFVCSASR